MSKRTHEAYVTLTLTRQLTPFKGHDSTGVNFNTYINQP